MNESIPFLDLIAPHLELKDELTEVFTKALEKGRGEKLVRKAIEAGTSAVDAFEKFGIM